MLGTVNGEPVMPGAGLLKRSQLDVLIQTLRARLPRGGAAREGRGHCL